ncbi:MAG: protein translocase subunit SecD [Acidobacteria bacterium]|nr:protein translocase subunit SecD [Acidobacteriota bacterium]
MMSKSLRNRSLVIVGVCLACAYLLFGPVRLMDPLTGQFSWSIIRSNFTATQLKANLAANIKLGLDLKGGSHLILQVQTDDALRSITDGNVEKAKDLLKQAGLAFKQATSPGLGQVVVELDDTSKMEEVKKKIGDDFGPGWTISTAGKNVVFTIKTEEAVSLRERATEQAMLVIDNRVNALGVTENTIQRHGPPQNYQILLQLPGVSDPERVKNLIRAESRLELKLVSGGPFGSEDEAKQSLGGTVPPDKEVLPASERRSGPDPASKQFYVVDRTPVITGADLRRADARPSSMGGNQYEILFSLRASGADRFFNTTSANIGKSLAIVLNNEIKSAPNIKGAIRDSGQIEGDFTREEAEDLALTLNSGALPARVVYLEERTVGPSLGADSIRQGIVSSLVGLAGVVLVVLFYYRFSGLNAVIALILNLVMLLASLRVVGAVLTLPGIAGVVLTIGMAVDSNVLIFERIREELKLGKVVRSAVSLGFDRAFITVLDTHVTTVVSAMFLFIFGTGPIRGFAVTLVAGLVANMFTAIFVSRTIFDYILSREGRSQESLSI